MSHSSLDNTEWLIARLGGERVSGSIHAFDQQVLTGLRSTLHITFPESYRKVCNIVLCGMGGSRFPALILQSLYKSALRVPFEICDDYTLPGSVGKDTLVILSSYSGTTEEVLWCAEEALRRSAQITGYCVGGPLQAFFVKHHLPHYIFTEEFNPSKQPRMGFGYAFGSLLGILVALSLISDVASDTCVDYVRDAFDESREMRSLYDVQTPTSRNPTKSLALSLHGRYPYYVVAEHLIGVGNCLQNQTNETAKNISSYRVIPELNHHLMEGLKNPPTHHDMATFVLFESALYSERIARRVTITKDVVEQNGIQTLSYMMRGRSRLGQVLEGLVLSSYLTMYLAALYGENPEVVPYVDYFKAQLRAPRA